jgi:hypothetical protein
MGRRHKRQRREDDSDGNNQHAARLDRDSLLEIAEGRVQVGPGDPFRPADRLGVFRREAGLLTQTACELERIERDARHPTRRSAFS